MVDKLVKIPVDQYAELASALGVEGEFTHQDLVARAIHLSAEHSAMKSTLYQIVTNARIAQNQLYGPREFAKEIVVLFGQYGKR